ncbi:LacI family transcriptional regulator [Paenibacillus sp. SC116]|uniref:LacI family transcriptional regulator n=1 Tax=Paenibacillus agilis TaxID=3020863 RepID=A0A559IWU2_9BACL|nr:MULTISPECIES: LacI family DNA-binding transcriptional regulator [Paenibacillus]MCR8843835.1 LacI family transcriptional regulator [Paenibacillus sp. SC116]TVX92104.1 LacI family transcriptional regulator [Paenibacillus agilis]
MKVSIFDVAKKAGLSVVTVSRVLNNAKTVREKNRQKVLQAMKELNYHPNAAARSLAKGKTGVIGVIVTTLQDSFLDTVVQHISSHLKQYSYYLAISVANYPTEVGAGKELIQEDRVDGLLVLAAVHEEDYVNELRRRKIPFVLIDCQNIQPSFSSVLVDNFQGGYEATKHLIDLGHTSIAHIKGSDYFLSAIERERGFRYALSEAGLKPFAVEFGQFTITSGYDAVQKWLQEGSLPTAVFAADDFTAIGVINALTEKGYQVPRDMSVIGYDDQLMFAELRPHLTTMKQPAEQLARHAVDVLMRQINGTNKRNITVRFEPELLIRETTAPVASHQLTHS